MTKNDNLLIYRESIFVGDSVFAVVERWFAYGHVGCTIGKPRFPWKIWKRSWVPLYYWTPWWISMCFACISWWFHYYYAIVHLKIYKTFGCLFLACLKKDVDHVNIDFFLWLFFCIYFNGGFVEVVVCGNVTTWKHGSSSLTLSLRGLKSEMCSLASVLA